MSDWILSPHLNGSDHRIKDDINFEWSISNQKLKIHCKPPIRDSISWYQNQILLTINLVIMKYLISITKQFALSIMIFYACSISAQAPPVYAVVDFMKVEPKKADQYLELEKAYKKLHKSRQEKEELLNWALYYLPEAGVGSDYNAVTVNFYRGNESLAGHFEKPMAANAEEILSEQELHLVENSPDFRHRIKTEVYQLKLNLDQDDTDFPKIIWMSYRYLKEGKGMKDLMEVEQNMVRPIIENGLENGTINSYQIYERKLPSGSSTNHQVAQLYTFDNLSQMLAYPPTHGAQFAKQNKGVARLNFEIGVSGIYKTEIWMLADCLCTP